MAGPNREVIQNSSLHLGSKAQSLTEVARHFKNNSLRFTVYHHSQKQKKDAALLRSFDVVLTTYGTIRAEHVQPDDPGEQGQGVIQSITWHRVVLDEGMWHLLCAF